MNCSRRNAHPMRDDPALKIGQNERRGAGLELGDKKLPRTEKTRLEKTVPVRLSEVSKSVSVWGI